MLIHENTRKRMAKSNFHKQVIAVVMAMCVMSSLPGSVSAVSSMNANTRSHTAFMSPHFSRIRRPLKKIDNSMSSLKDASSSPVDTTTTNDKNDVDICIIGGGISGLSAAITSAKQNPSLNICLLEANDRPGGRVSSDITHDGFILDQGFAVFIENYPQSKSIFDYDDLQLKKFDPGAMIRLSDKFASIADPLRQPRKTITALTSPVGTPLDKLKLAPLFFNVKRKNIDELFNEDEMDTLSCLKHRYKFSEKMIIEFFTPFLEGIFLCPLDQQSSRLFHFVFKMNADGSSTLPTGGMQSVSDQLARKAIDLGVDIRFNHVVNRITKDSNGFMIDNRNKNDSENNRDPSPIISSKESSSNTVHAKKVICATEGVVAHALLSTLDEFSYDETFLNLLKDQPQKERSVGCIYYSFQGDVAPIMDPILILNSGKNKGPINNVCFPSVVNDSYAPKGYHLCSVAITEGVIETYRGREDELDRAVREELASWFDDFSDDILNVWEQKGPIYEIKNAQPSNFGGSFPANVNGGRDCTQFRGINLPSGIFVCGDYMSTSTLNGAIESGINAANVATAL